MKQHTPMTIISVTEFKRFLPPREAKKWYGENMSNRHDLGSLAIAITSYLTSKYFTELAPGTQRMRRALLNNVFAEVQRLSADGPSEAREPVDLPPRASLPRRPVHRRGSWMGA